MMGELQEFLTGERPSPSVDDRVLATVLFTDIVGSTSRASALGDKTWTDLLARHEGIGRRMVERYRGRFINTTGDGLLATFEGPARAIRCAREMRSEIGKLGLDIRAGLHTGEIELSGENVSGMGVHIGARISALAGPGEVLASSTVKDLVTGSGIKFEDRGSHELKGVPDEWRIYAVKE
jgi:class 3 adenylate cyclase